MLFPFINESSFMTTHALKNFLIRSTALGLKNHIEEFGVAAENFFKELKDEKAPDSLMQQTHCYIVTRLRQADPEHFLVAGSGPVNFHPGYSMTDAAVSQGYRPIDSVEQEMALVAQGVITRLQMLSHVHGGGEEGRQLAELTKKLVKKYAPQYHSAFQPVYPSMGGFGQWTPPTGLSGAMYSKNQLQDSSED